MHKTGFDFNETTKFVNKFRKTSKLFDAWLLDFMYGIAEKLVREIAKRTPVDTGLLRDSWRVEKVEKQGREIVAWFRNDQDYASHVEWGHAWPYYGGIASEGDIEWVPGRFMMRISLQKAYADLPKEFRREFQEFLRRNDL